MTLNFKKRWSHTRGWLIYSITGIKNDEVV